MPPSARRPTSPARALRSSPRRQPSIARRGDPTDLVYPGRQMTPCRLSALLALVLAAGCQGQPSLLCDRARVVWPFFEIDTSDDIDPADEGIQIDIDLRTSYLPGSVGYLTIEPEEGDPVAHPESSVVGDDGDLHFHSVTVPLGRVLLSVSLQN